MYRICIDEVCVRSSVLTSLSPTTSGAAVGGTDVGRSRGDLAHDRGQHTLVPSEKVIANRLEVGLAPHLREPPGELLAFLAYLVSEVVHPPHARRARRYARAAALLARAARLANAWGLETA